MTVTSETVLFYDKVNYPRRKPLLLPVSIQTLAEDEYANYCVRCGGNGHYFKCLDDARIYILNRFKRSIDLAAVIHLPTENDEQDKETTTNDAGGNDNG